jgi:NADPH-dependent 2,4-dienoyl-CoA reductase/sulfur reductase-like enzyme/pSer/pThr/pTyr-binding forkhead associated (FHA) protein
MSRRRYLIIGDGAAGTTAAQFIRQADPNARISIVADDPNPAYFRAALTNYLLGELREDQIWAVPPNYYADLAIERKLARVAAVDSARSSLWLTSGGAPEPYDELLVATGSRARPPSFDGADLPGTMTMRTLHDVRAVLDLIKLHGLKQAVVVGGGPLALEWAQGLKERGAHVTMVLREGRFLGGALDEVGSDLLLARLRQSGVGVVLEDEIAAALPGPGGRVAAVRTKRGQTLPCELVAVAIGVVCNTELLQGSGVAIGQRGGIVVDDAMRTSVRNIYAAGDVAEHNGRLLQLWEPARLQGRTAGMNMAGQSATYSTGVHYFATRLYDLDFASVGSIANKQGATEIVDFPRSTGKISYRKLVVHNGRLVGALMLGERREKVRQRGRVYQRLIETQADVSGITKQLLDATFDIEGWLKSRVLVERPKAPATTALPTNAKLRGTQMLQAVSQPAPTMRSAEQRSTSAVAQSSPQGSFVPVAASSGAASSAQAGTRMLSIGLGTQQLELPTILPPSTASSPYLEGAAGRFSLDAVVVTLGRDPASAVRIDDPAACHVHAQILRHGDDAYLRDLGSRSGTWVNGAQVTTPHRLRDGDRIRIGSIELVFRRPGATSLGDRRSAETPASARLPHVEIRSGRSIGLRFVLDGPRTIGRDATHAIRLDDLSISTHHASLRFDGARWLLSDLGSTNGTWRNGARIAQGQEIAIADGDVVYFGDVAASFSLAGSVQLAPAAPKSASPATACVQCGAALAAGAKFCTTCGRSTGGVTHP